MNPLRYEVSEERRRLTGMLEQRGSQTGLSVLGGILFGLVFAAAGTLLILVGTKTIAVNPGSVHAPYWVLTVFGAVFALPGLWMWAMAWRQHAANQRSREAARRQPNEPAFADYPWNPRGCESQRWRRAFTRLLGALFLTLFLSGFNYLAFAPKTPWIFKGVIFLFDLVALVFWYTAVLAVGRAIKFGGSTIAFTSFPYRLGTPILIRWHPASGINQATKGSFTLRCVEEWHEVRGTGKNRSRHIVHEEIWSGTWRLEQQRTFQHGAKVDFSFEPPADLYPTSLSAERPIFWEFEAKLDLPGFDFEETYLVPIYGRIQAGVKS